MSVNFEPTQQEIVAVQDRIGQAIDNRYGDKRTPIGIQKITCLALAALAMIVTAVLAVSGVVLMSSGFVILGTSSLTACFLSLVVGLVAFECSRDLCDWNNSDYRNEVINDIAQKSFAEIVDSPGIRTRVVDYALLGPGANARLYAIFHKMLQYWTVQNSEVIEKHYLGSDPDLDFDERQNRIQRDRTKMEKPLNKLFDEERKARHALAV